VIDAGSQPSSRENVGDGAAWLRAFLKRSRSATARRPSLAGSHEHRPSTSKRVSRVHCVSARSDEVHDNSLKASMKGINANDRTLNVSCR
jgi:hypothetical protein